MTKLSRRSFLILFLLSACSVQSTARRSGKLVVGTVSYDQGNQVIQKSGSFKDYLAEKTGAWVELEPTFNEAKALERIRQQAWSVVLAPPGLAAIAMIEARYKPIFPLAGVSNRRSVIVVRQDNPVRSLTDLGGQTIALGQQGSATGYYFPIYNLYGLSLREILFAPTPKAVLEWVADGTAAAGALSKEELTTHGSALNGVRFRVLHADAHAVPPGVVLLSPTVEGKLQDQIRRALSETPSVLAQDVGFIPNGRVPDYQYMITVVKRVRDIAGHVREQPANLF